MAVRDMMSDLRVSLAFDGTPTNSAINGVVIDTLNAGSGVGFAFWQSQTGTGTVTISFQESDAPNMVGAVTLTDKVQAHSGFTLTGIDSNDALRFSIISNKRFVRAVVTGSGIGGTHTVRGAAITGRNITTGP